MAVERSTHWLVDHTTTTQPLLLQCWPLNVKPCNDKPRSSGKSNTSRFLLSPLTFFSLLSTLALAGFGKKWKTIPGPFKLLMRGL